VGLQQALPQRHRSVRRQQPAASPRAAQVYAKAIDRGHDHPHAIRILARAWIRVIYRCWNDGIPYDPTKHGNADKLYQASAA